MATAVKCVTALHVSASASVGFSSEFKSASFSSVFSIPAQWRVPGFKSLSLNPKFIGPFRTFASVRKNGGDEGLDFEGQGENERVFAKIIEVKNELAQSKEEIEKLRAVMESKLTNIDKVLNSVKKIDQELSAEPIPENHSDHEEHVSENPGDDLSSRNLF